MRTSLRPPPRISGGGRSRRPAGRASDADTHPSRSRGDRMRLVGSDRDGWSRGEYGQSGGGRRSKRSVESNGGTDWADLARRFRKFDPDSLVAIAPRMWEHAVNGGSAESVRVCRKRLLAGDCWPATSRLACVVRSLVGHREPPGWVGREERSIRTFDRNGPCVTSLRVRRKRTVRSGRDRGCSPRIASSVRTVRRLAVAGESCT
jgi:hypothetical protein